MLNGQFVSCYSDFHISDFAERRSFLVGLIMSRIRVGPVKNDCILFYTVFPFAIFVEYRIRLGVVKFKNFVFICPCTRLSLYLSVGKSVMVL